MKIYCSRKENITLYDFIGKDAWVKCGKNNVYQYVKPLREWQSNGYTGPDMLVVNNIWCEDIDDAYDHNLNIGKDAIICSLHQERGLTVDLWPIVFPLDVLSTEELIDILLYKKDNCKPIEEMEEEE